MNKLILFLSILTLIIVFSLILIFKKKEQFSNQTSLVFFSRSNCNKCDEFNKNVWRKMIFSEKYMDIFFNRYDLDDNYNLAQSYGVYQAPALVMTSPIFKVYQEEYREIDGNFSDGDVKKWLNKYARRDLSKINWISVNRPS